MSYMGTSPKVAQGRPRSPGEVGRRSPGKRTSPVGGAFRGRPCLGARANGSGQDQPGDLSARQLALFSGPPAEPRSGASGGGEQAGGAGDEPGLDHVWYWHRPHKGADCYDPPRRGRRCRVRCRGRGRGPLNVAVELDDGELVCAPRWAVRRAT